MKSTFGALNTVTRGLYAQQVGLDTTGHNISNANTAGYSRQTVNLATTRPGTIYGSVGAMQLGTGVDITSIKRVRDIFMDKQMWQENSTLGYSQTVETTLGKIENVFKDQLPDIGIQSALNKFWNAWQTLSTTASNDSARLAVREQGNALVSTIKTAADQIKNLITDVNSNLALKVTSVNQIASEIASLNKQISNVEVGDRDHANDLRDRRDYLVDQLANLGETRVTEDKDHNYLVQFGDISLVTGNNFTKLSTPKPAAVDTYYGYEVSSIVVAANPSQAVRFKKGELGALLGDPSDAGSFVGLAGAKRALDRLDTMSGYLMKDFNAVHKAGYGTDDSSNHNFFDQKADTSFADTNYNAVGYTPPTGGWISLLKVNRDLYQTNGLAKIAAKTAPSLTITQSDASAGKANISGDYTGVAGRFTITITGVDPTTNKVTGISYSLDNPGPPVTNILSGGPLTPISGTEDTFQLPNGLTIAVAANANNSATDTYTFDVPYRGNASGDNAVNLANALKLTTSATLGGSSLDEYYAGFVGEIGIQMQNATRLTENQKTLVDQIITWRESVSGVNMDEEMTNMIRYQKGYNAAARVLTTLDEMLDKLINGTGVVGR